MGLEETTIQLVQTVGVNGTFVIGTMFAAYQFGKKFANRYMSQQDVMLSKLEESYEHRITDLQEEIKYLRNER